MPNVSVICYLSSLLFYGMGYSKSLIIKNAVTEHVNTYDYTMHISLATAYFVFAIFLAVIGSVLFYMKNYKAQEIIDINAKEFKVKAAGKTNDRRRSSILEVKAQLTQSKYCLDLDRRMSS